MQKLTQNVDSRIQKLCQKILNVDIPSRIKCNVIYPARKLKNGVLVLDYEFLHQLGVYDLAVYNHGNFYIFLLFDIELNLIYKLKLSK